MSAMPLMHETLGCLAVARTALDLSLDRRHRHRDPPGRCGVAAGGAGRGSAPVAGLQEILADRFARGEIDATEYRARLDTLRQ